MLFLLELLGIFRVFFLQCVYLGLQRRLLLLRLTALDVGIDLNKPQNEGGDEYCKKIAVAKHAVKPTHGIEKPFGQEKIVEHSCPFFGWAEAERQAYRLSV